MIGGRPTRRQPLCAPAGPVASSEPRWTRQRAIDMLRARVVSQRHAMASLSRQLARWVAGLAFEDLPTPVVDRAKGVTLHGLTSALLGARLPAVRDAVALVVGEEAGVTVGA